MPPSRVPGTLNGVGTTIAASVFVLFRTRVGSAYVMPHRLFAIPLVVALYLLLVWGSLYLLSIARSAFGLEPTAWSVPVSTWATALVFVILSLTAIAYRFSLGLRSVRSEAPNAVSTTGESLDWSNVIGLGHVYRFLGGDPWYVQLLFEPALVAALGILLLIFQNWFGGYLLIAAILINVDTARREHQWSATVLSEKESMAKLDARQHEMNIASGTTSAESPVPIVVEVPGRGGHA